MSSKSDVTPNLQPGSDLERVFEGEFGDGEETRQIFNKKSTKKNKKIMNTDGEELPKFSTSNKFIRAK